MTPEELYNILSSKYPQFVVDSICCVDKRCKDAFCSEKQGWSVLSFDDVKESRYKIKKRELPMPASVDAVCIGKKQKYFCFVELKGWERYIANFEKQKKSIPETAGDYNLENKLKDSQNICKEITGDDDLFAQIPVIFLLVTDIDVKERGIESFSDMLTTLAQTGTDIYSECVTNAKKTLDSEIHIDHDYIFCKDFDDHIKDL